MGTFNKKDYRTEIESLLIKHFMSAGYSLTKSVEVDPLPESSKYHALNFGLNNLNIVYRKGNITPDRPGAFLAVWKRPAVDTLNHKKPIPLTSDELDYLFISVENDSQCGFFIFPVALLIQKGIVSSLDKAGKTGFRVFPPWSQDRGIVGTKIFSESGKKTQKWQIPYFIEMDSEGNFDSCQLNKLLN